MTEQDRREQKIQAVRKRLDECVSQFDIFRQLREVTETHGFRYFLVVSMPVPVAGPVSDSIVITSAPSDLVQRFEDDRLVADSPLAAILGTAGAPAEYRFENAPTPQRAENRTQIDNVIDNHDFNCGIVVPVHDPDRGAAAICFLGTRAPVSFCEMAELTLYGNWAHHRLCRVSAQPAKMGSPLSERERECLIWTSGGKTSVEIARILGLSEHTVNHYLNNAARKLNAGNRTQAVAFAMRQGFID